MEIASVVFEHGFDKAMLEQIDTLRTIRLGLAETMLKDLDRTASEIDARGLLGDEGAVDRGELRRELEGQIATLRSRLARPDVIFEDEISLYVELLDADDDLGEGLEEMIRE